MARAKMLPPPPPVLSVTLDLTAEEAQTLYDVLRNVGGCPKKSRRRYASSVLDAMEEIGYESHQNDAKGSIDFTSDSK